MSAEVEVARQWIQKARNDLLNADNNLAAEETHFDTICFHESIPNDRSWTRIIF